MLAHHTIISKIGAGGMGEVYRARDTRLDREQGDAKEGRPPGIKRSET
jgi:serine/threonine protein kinase